MPKPKIAQVVFPIPLDREFDYKVPPSLKAAIGSRVLVDFHGKKRMGIVCAFTQEPHARTLKDIIDVLDRTSLLSKRQLSFARKLSRNYLCAFGEILFMMLPPYLRQKRKTADIFKERSFRSSSQSLVCVRSSQIVKRFEYYKNAIHKALKSNRSVMVIFPRFVLLREMLGEFRKEFRGEEISILSSYQRDRDNYFAWRKIKQGNSRLILGTKMALFLYPQDLGLLVVEEESSPLYFHPEKPHYHLIDVAGLLASFKKIDLILATDYPTFATFKRIKEKRVSLKEIDEPRANIQIIDSRRVRTRESSLFTPFLMELLRKNLSEKKRTLIFWNRKGYASVIKCSGCGHVFRCKRCSSFLRYELSEHKGYCPFCHWSRDIPKVCTRCKSGYTQTFGLGAERLQGIIKRFFPEVKVGSLDEPGADILVATQKVFTETTLLKGSLDCAIVLDADYLLSRIDYHATFRVFIYLKRLSSLVKEKVYVFTNNPEHYLFETINQSWQAFYAKELKLRKDLGYPPYGHLAKLTLRAKNKERLFKNTSALYDIIKDKGLEVFGPLKEVPFKLRDQYYYSLVIKEKKSALLRKALSEELGGIRSSSIKVAVVIQ